MAEQPLAFSSLSPPVCEEDYERLHAAIAETAQGRWFLQEYARRHRAADMQLLLDAIARLERFLATSDAARPLHQCRG
jgi:chemotaxis protein CheZ